MVALEGVLCMVLGRCGGPVVDCVHVLIRELMGEGVGSEGGEEGDCVSESVWCAGVVVYCCAAATVGNRIGDAGWKDLSEIRRLLQRNKVTCEISRSFHQPCCSVKQVVRW